MTIAMVKELELQEQHDPSDVLSGDGLGGVRRER
jgi:hypothetical protein